MAPPALLVHGFSSSFAKNWRELGWVDLLGDAGRTVIGGDLLGHGQAAKPHDPQAYSGDEGLEALVASWIPEGAEDDPIDAVGFSLGARLLLSVASERRPGAVGRLVVGGVGENLFVDRNPDALAQALAGESGGEEVVDPLGRAFLQVGAAPDQDGKALAACLRRPQPPLTEEQLGRISIPVLVVIGDRDQVGNADRLVAALPDAKLVTLAGVDHLGTMKGFGFLDAALTFLEAIPT